MHIIVPDLELITRQYLLAKSNGDISAADKFLEETLLTRPVRGSKRFEILEAIGGMGLAHRWMYDQESIADMIQQAGFQIDDSLTTPSDHVRCNDGISIHVRALKIG